MVDELRRKMLKGALAGIGFAWLGPMISVGMPRKKERFYGMNLTRRMSNGKIVDKNLFELVEYANIKDFIIHIGYFQKNRYSNEIMCNIDKERVVPEDRCVLDLIENLKSKGNKITIAPTIYISQNKDWQGHKWRGKIEPNNFSLWFKNYEEILMNYIKLTEELKVDAFCIGLELNSMQKYTKKWVDIIKNVRKEFNGKITYCANWDAYKDTYFVDNLDYLSISAYFPLRKPEEKSSLEGLINSWKNIGEELLNFKKKYKKEIVFGEIGYRSAEGSATQHSVNLDKQDFEEQRLCFKALDYVLKKEIISVKKAYLWVDDTHNITHLNKVGYGIFGKPAEKDFFL